MPAVYYSWGNQHSSMVFSALCLSLSVYLPTTVTLSMIGRAPTTNLPALPFLLLDAVIDLSFGLRDFSYAMHHRPFYKSHPESALSQSEPMYRFMYAIYNEQLESAFVAWNPAHNISQKPNAEEGLFCVIILVFPARNMQST